MIHDLHAKYEVAVNKAERVAEEAIKFTAESLNEQGRCQIEICFLSRPKKLAYLSNKSLTIDCLM